MQLFNSSGRDVAAVFMPDSIGRNTKKDYIRIEHEAGGAVFFYPPSLDGCKRKTPDARAKKSFERSEIRTRHERGESAGEAVNRLCREP